MRGNGGGKEESKRELRTPGEWDGEICDGKWSEGAREGGMER